jgi:hypothetical protein
VPPVFPEIDKGLLAAFGAVGFGIALALYLLIHCLCYGCRKCGEIEMEERVEQAWQERHEAREARRAREGLRYDVPRCYVPKPPPAYVEAIEMA